MGLLGAILGPSWGRCGPSWGHLGASFRCPGAVWGHRGPRQGSQQHDAALIRMTGRCSRFPQDMQERISCARRKCKRSATRRDATANANANANAARKRRRKLVKCLAARTFDVIVPWRGIPSRIGANWPHWISTTLAANPVAVSSSVLTSSVGSDATRLSHAPPCC